MFSLPSSSKRAAQAAVFGIASALAVSGVVAAPASAATPTGISVLIYSDPAYVDYGTAADVAGGDYDHEGINMQLALTAAGNTVSTVDATSAASFAAALAGKNVFVIPETENGDLSADLDEATITVVQDWVKAGGTLIAACDYNDVLNTLFGYNLADKGGTTWTLTASPGPTFAGGPATLPDNDGTSSMDSATLPAGTVSAYDEAASTSSAVFDTPYGGGEVVYLGWDWYDAAPADPAGQDSGWNAVLQRAVETGRPAPTPPAPAPAKAPGEVTGLKVVGKKTAKKRTVVWSAPASNGGSPITGYRVVVQQRKKAVYDEVVSASTLSFTVKSKKVHNATKAKVKVKAINAVGTSTWVKLKFATVER